MRDKAEARFWVKRGRCVLKDIKIKLTFSEIILLLSIIYVGGFNEHISCLISCIASVYFFVEIFSKKEIRLQVNLFSISITVLCLFYGLTCFWAIDAGMSFIGCLKFMPVFLYMLILWQEEKEKQILDILPYIAAGLVVVSAVGAQIPFLKAFFVVAGRFAGFFQYPNTFALFLLLCELLILQKARLKVIDYAVAFVLIGGLLYTGSRTVFLLFITSNIAMLMLIVKRKARIKMILVMSFSIITVLFIMYLFKDNAIISRYLNMDFGASTFIGRILYFVDALPLLIKYPFGMGYMGYYYIQNSIQTGVYNVTYVHNDFLQIFLDTGWLPGILFLLAVISFFFKKTVTKSRKLIVGTFCLHTLFDFNLQFIAMFLLLVTLMDVDNEKVRIFKIKKWMKSIPIVIFVLNIYMAVALLFAHYEQREIANAIYPYNTRNTLQMMEVESDLEEANRIADRIIKQNKTYFAPYSIKSKYAYLTGDFVEVIRNKNEVFLRYPFKYTEYKEYCVMLINGAALYERQGDKSSVDICNSEILAAYDKLMKNKTRLSKLGRRIEEQPTLEFSDSVLTYINKLKGENE